MITQFKRPMLAASLLPPDVEHSDEQILLAMKKLRYPVAATLKRDGIRALRLNGTLLSRTLKRIPNAELRKSSLVMPGGIDMELWSKDLQYNEIESIVMSHEHLDTDKVQFHILDWFKPELCYVMRIQSIMQLMPSMPQNLVKFSPPVMCQNAEQLFAFLKVCEDAAGEGICFRTLTSPYCQKPTKDNRSTLAEQWLVKFARSVREEATIVGFVEQMENTNRAKYDKLGRMDRASYQDGMVGKGTLGALWVERTVSCTGPDNIIDVSIQKFKIGTGVGLTNALRKEIWSNQSKYLGRQITYKCKAHGAKIKPRSPIMVGFRTEGF